MMTQHTGNFLHKNKEQVVKIAKILENVQSTQINQVFDLLNYLKDELDSSKFFSTVVDLSDKFAFILSKFDSADQLFEIATQSIEFAQFIYDQNIEISSQNVRFQTQIKDLQEANIDLLNSLREEKSAFDMKLRELYSQLYEKTSEKKELQQNMTMMIQDKTKQFLEILHKQHTLRQMFEEKSLQAKTSIQQLQQKNKLLEFQVSHLNEKIRQLKNQAFQSTLYESPGETKSGSQSFLPISEIRVLEDEPEEQGNNYHKHNFQGSSEHPHSLTHDLQLFVAQEEEIEQDYWQQMTSERILKKQFSAIDIHSITESKKSKKIGEKPFIMPASSKVLDEFSPIKNKNMLTMDMLKTNADQNIKNSNPLMKSAFSMKNLHSSSINEQKSEPTFNKIHNFFHNKIVESKLKKFKKKN